MSPLYISVRNNSNNNIYGIAARVANSESSAMSVHTITVVDVGLVADDIPMYSASHGQAVGHYRCVKNMQDKKYYLIRTTCGDNHTVRAGVKKLKECQQFALIDYCNVNGLEPIKELKNEKRY